MDKVFEILRSFLFVDKNNKDFKELSRNLSIKNW